ncbi:ADP-heptose--lipooligosaccharide heptosyltransferase II [hydrothermal vent metagenome]|uniref:lipopolysaccharide heptosyltransferase II n=1 Tax=hydrothermal vent metagenome TaxID=652676 RepID=A0A3B1CLD8_9ZZZZ
MSDKKHPQKILVRMPNWLGDAVMALPVILGLKELFPTATIDIAIKNNFAGLIGLLPLASDVIALPDKNLRLTRSGRYHTALILPNSFRAAWDIWRAGIPERIGFAGDMRSFLLTRPLPRPAKHSMSQAEYFKTLALAAFPGFQAGGLKLLAPGLAINSAMKLLPKENTPLIGIGFGASFGAAKMWPAERFALLIDRLDELGSVVLLGAESDRGVEQKVLGLSKSNPLSLVGATDIQTLAGVFSRLSLYITNDTGPMHLAAAIGTPVIALFGPTSPAETKPLDKNAEVIYHGADCAPCWKRSCPLDHRCMTAITVDEVEKEAIRKLWLP